MANIKSAKKNIRIIERRTSINKSRRSRVKTFLKKVLESVKEGNVEAAKTNLVNFESEIMKAASKGVYKKNTAARKIKRAAAKIKNITK